MSYYNVDVQKVDSGHLIRDGQRADMNAVAEMVQELANAEKMPKSPKLSAKDLKRDGFETQPPAFYCKVAEDRDSSEIVGYALYFPTYSSWEGRAIMLEDLYVRQSVRRQGVGEKLFNAVAKEVVANGWSRLDFHVLDWNDASNFYERRGAVNLTRTERWCYYRLGGDALQSCARKHI